MILQPEPVGRHPVTGSPVRVSALPARPRVYFDRALSPLHRRRLLSSSVATVGLLAFVGMIGAGFMEIEAKAAVIGSLMAAVAVGLLVPAAMARQAADYEQARAFVIDGQGKASLFVSRPDHRATLERELQAGTLALFPLWALGVEQIAALEVGPTKGAAAGVVVRDNWRDLFTMNEGRRHVFARGDFETDYFSELRFDLLAMIDAAKARATPAAAPVAAAPSTSTPEKGFSL